MTIVIYSFVVSCANERLYDNATIALFFFYISIKISRKQKLALKQKWVKPLGLKNYCITNL
jgi:hypothetical protein